jgi:hypothetical protein
MSSHVIGKTGESSHPGGHAVCAGPAARPQTRSRIQQIATQKVDWRKIFETLNDHCKRLWYNLGFPQKASNSDGSGIRA